MYTATERRKKKMFRFQIPLLLWKGQFWSWKPRKQGRGFRAKSITQIFNPKLATIMHRKAGKVNPKSKLHETVQSYT